MVDVNRYNQGHVHEHKNALLENLSYSMLMHVGIKIILFQFLRWADDGCCTAETCRQVVN